MGAVLVFLRGYPGVQPLVLLVLSMMSMLLMCSRRVYLSKVQARLEMGNEFCVYICTLMYMAMGELKV